MIYDLDSEAAHWEWTQKKWENETIITDKEGDQLKEQIRKNNGIFDELSYLSSVEKYLDPATFVDTGFTLSFINRDERKGSVDQVCVTTNETNSLYFCQERSFDIKDGN